VNRRDALRLLATGMALPIAPRGLLASMRQAREAVGTQAAPRTLNPHQYATVKAMAEMIIPRTDTPGATDVGAAHFIDLILTEWYEESAKAAFLDGLADVDQHTQALFGHDFTDCSAAQQAETLVGLGQTLPAGSARQQYGRGSSPETHDSFYVLLRRLTLTAYYTSEAGATGELHFEIIPESHAGCAAVTGGKKAAERQ
jgi:gluconate 2-dehydrogenase gamma chain